MTDASGPDARELPRELLDPAAYPPPTPSAVSLRETHLSWVFLTDRDAWKLKRPVDYGFVDATSIEKRRHYCREEVRLGRRLAPDVYLGVEPLRRDVRGRSFVRDGDVVDYAVRMRRMPDELSAAARLERGALTAEDLERLADRLADFYAAAAVDPAFDAAAAFRANVAENFEQVRPFAGRLVDAALFEAVRSAQESFLDRHASLLASRQGRVREGHGDLRLEHVYFERDEILVLDPIEFNARFRFADAALDAGFLAMELAARGRTDLGEGFLGRFALATNDYDFYPLADFYLSYRAWVRAKVACFVVDGPETPADKKARKAAEAGALFELSRRLLLERPRPARLVVVGGEIGSGKSTLARTQARRRGLAVVSSDRTRKFLAGLRPTEPGGPELYTAEATHRVYAEVLRRAARVLESGRSVILDARFSTRAERLEARELARQAGVPFLFIETRAEKAELRRRLEARREGPSISDARADLLDAFRAGFEPVDELDPAEHVVVDTTRPLPDGLDPRI